MQIPNNLKFVQNETGWTAPRFGSFEAIVTALIHHRRMRPDLIKKHGWSIDPVTVANEVDAYNAKLCAQQGWTQYIYEAGAPQPPKSSPLSQAALRSVQSAVVKSKRLWAGAETIHEWIESGEPAVAQELANSRALKCSQCPKNGKGSWEEWFTRPASEVIKRQVEMLSARKLSTPYDDKIQACLVCYCPLRLKVFSPIKFIKAHTSNEVLNDLEAVPGCWVVKEMKA